MEKAVEYRTKATNGENYLNKYELLTLVCTSDCDLLHTEFLLNSNILCAYICK